MSPYYYINNATIGEFTGDRIDTLSEAERQALDLAKLNPGACFEILRCVGYSSTSKASTFWMDGEEPEPRTGIDCDKQLYKLLTVGEVIQAGDEFYYDDTWKKHGLTIGDPIDENNFPTRRPL